MKKSTFLGSVIGVLLAFSVISYASTYVQPQDPKPVQHPNQQPNPPADAAKNEELAAPTTVSTTDSTLPASNKPSDVLRGEVTLPVEVYSATAYSLRGRTASGRFVSRGLIAADPRVLPIGTRVRVEAGPWSGEYLVADTGGAVKGRRIDIWTPTSGEAMRFGRRAVKLTVLEMPNRRLRTTATTRPRVVSSPAVNPSTESAATKQ